MRYLAEIPLLLFGLLLLGNSCMGWPGVTALLVDGPDESESRLPPILALLSAVGWGGGIQGCLGQGYCWIFVTSDAWSPAGLAAADAFCQNQKTSYFASFPGTYRALLITQDYLTRDLTHNWVMYPATEYRTASNGNAVVGTTNLQGIFTFPLLASIGSTAVYTWTGATASWGISPGFTCSNWSSAANVYQGGRGSSGDSDSLMIQAGVTVTCDDPATHLYCVQQQ